MSRRTEYLLLVASAVFVGLMYILPPVLIWQQTEKIGSGFLLAQLGTYKDELTVYLPRAHEVYDGHFPPQDLYFDKQHPTVLNPLPSLMFSAFIFLFKGNINYAYLGAQFFFSAIIFLLFYFIGQQIFKSKNWSFLFAFIGVLTPAAIIYYRLGSDAPGLAGVKEIVLVLLKQFVPFIRTPINKFYLARIDDALLTFPIFLLAILSFLGFWKKPSVSMSILAGVFSGLLFYTYFAYWIYWTIFIMLMFTYSIFYKKGLHRSSFIILVIVLVVMFVPYFVNYIKFSEYADSQDLALRLGATQGRNLDIIKRDYSHFLFHIFLALVVYLSYFKKDKGKAILFLALIAATTISWNAQLVTGFAVNPGQVKKAAAVTFFIILFTLIHDFVKKIESRDHFFNSFSKIFMGALLVIVPLKGFVNILVMVNPSSDILSNYSFSGDIKNSWGWIEDNLNHEPKIISSSLVNSLYLTTYTSARPFLVTGFMSSAPMSTLENRYLIANKLFNVDEATLEKKMERRSVGLNDCKNFCPPDSWFNLHKDIRFLYVNYWLSQDTTVQPVPETRVLSLLERYRILSDNWNDIDADYVYYGPWEKQFSSVDFNKDKNLKLVYKNPEVAIYKIIR